MTSGSISDQLLEKLTSFWGYDSFRPLQLEAMECVMSGRDSVVVLPTGGGKSLCFQIPALCLPGTAVVVSPLISLMKDQVDALSACGIPAAFLNSSLTSAERRMVISEVSRGKTRLLYVAPERLMNEGTLEFLRSIDVSLFAIDEAHCISAWGHDFRPEYRALSMLKELFPEVGVHAYTATASEDVRDDIVRELSLSSAVQIVGPFDRPNLIYKVQRRQQRLEQILSVLKRYPDQSGIIYCISRADVDSTCAALVGKGYRALPYHAGLTDEQRRSNQEAFIADQTDVIVATVAFGMGIDKPDVRFVIHAGMPKSLENYQQESGRAGRDGLEAECCLFYSGQDFNIWKNIIDDSEASAQEGALRSLSGMYQFCTGVVCRHQAIVEYFGQTWQKEACDACDVCLGELETIDDPIVVGQKILSCVVRLQQRFGGDYTAMVLNGSNDKRILQFGHDQLSTWGLLADENKRTVRDWIEQLVSQQYLKKVGEYNVLQVTNLGWQLLRGEETPRLLKPRSNVKKAAAKRKDSWDDVDRGLFEHLRQVRRQIATEKGVPAYIIFNDAALRDMARLRPTNLEEFAAVKGVGEKKLNDLGQFFCDTISVYVHQPHGDADLSDHAATSE